MNPAYQESRQASVLATGQKPSRLQRQGRYTPESMRHPAKMLPAIAAQVIQDLTEPGDLVVDPMCGIGTTLVEAVHLGRDAAGMEYEPQWAQMAAANVLLAQRQGATGAAYLAIGDARTIATAHARLRGRAALALTSPPYGSHTHGHVRSGTREGDGSPVTKWNHRYSTDRGNLAHRRMPELMDAFGEILAAASALLRPGGVIAVTVRPIRVRGELIDLPGRVIDTAHQHGLLLVGRRVALLAGLRDGGLVTRASFFQMLETGRARDKGIPACTTAHEDLLLFQPATDLNEEDPTSKRGARDERPQEPAPHQPDQSDQPERPEPDGGGAGAAAAGDLRTLRQGPLPDPTPSAPRRPHRGTRNAAARLPLRTELAPDLDSGTPPAHRSTRHRHSSPGRRRWGRA
ncbi:TRM11 family SAM-dependent methyltransferase [Actinomadura sp. 9N407]|uniref:TRM11 family SAM-dependent methyltransferase n=1 Tax=Actinomadura sp. 9N407 TaxID=3375154 RepID=UPI0037B75421